MEFAEARQQYKGIAKKALTGIITAIESQDEFKFVDKDVFGKARKSVEKEIESFFDGLKELKDLDKRWLALPHPSYLKLRFVQELGILALKELQKEPTSLIHFSTLDEATKLMEVVFESKDQVGPDSPNENGGGAGGVDMT